MSKIIANSQDLGRACSVDLYQTYVPPEDEEEVHYDMDGVVRGMAEAVAEELPHYCKAITSVKVVETGSPEYYNYSTDWSDYEIEYDEAEVGRWCEEHKAEWSEWYSGWKSDIEWLEDDDPQKARRMEIARLGCYINHQPHIRLMLEGLYDTMFEVYEENIID